MPRSRPASNPLSYHRHTGQYYVTRGGRRTYLGADREAALEKYHRLSLGLVQVKRPAPSAPLTAKELANRFLQAQQANWRNPERTLQGYRDWLSRFLVDHPRLVVTDFSVESFAVWKLSLRKRGYAPRSINHYLGAVRAMFSFAADNDLIPAAPRLHRVKQERLSRANDARLLYTDQECRKLLSCADRQFEAMILLALNCGFGPKDMHDLGWNDIRDGRVTLARSKTGVGQTYVLWPETADALAKTRIERSKLIARLRRRNRERSDAGHVFITLYCGLSSLKLLHL